MNLEYNNAMMENDNTIFVTLNKLADFAKFAADWNDIAADCDADPMADCEFEGTYPLTLEDVKEALTYVRDGKVSNDKFLMGWWFPLVLKCDDALMIRDIFTGQSAPSGSIEPVLPLTDDDMLVYVLDCLADYSNSDLARNGSAPVTEYLDIDALLSEIETHEEENDLPAESRHFSERMRERFIMQLDNDILLGDSDEGTLRLWRKFTDELAEMGNFNAMRIKAYACYGGNNVYECDWKESARLLDILWRKHSFGQAANTLGYIYYYGRISPDGKPDYEKAFFYFSIGSTYGIVESKYKLADMFVNGYYVARNEKLARDIVGELYGDTRYRFEYGDYGCEFADVAYRMGRLFRDISNYELDPASRKGALEVSKIYLLQARFAIDLRMKNNYAYGDDKVRSNVTRLLAEVSSMLPVADKGTYHSYNPIFISIFTDNRPGERFKVTVKKYKNGNLRIVLKRSSAGITEFPKTMVVLPWFDECYFADSLDFTVSCISKVYVSPDINKESDTLEFTIDRIKSAESGLGDDDFILDFISAGISAMKISASEIIYKRHSKKRS